MSPEHTNRYKNFPSVSRFMSIRYFFLLIIGGISVLLFALLLWSGVIIMNSLLYQSGSDILAEKLNGLIQKIDFRYTLAENSGVGRESEQYQKIKASVLEELGRFHYKKSGSLFVVEKNRNILLSNDFNNPGVTGFAPFFSALQEGKETFRYRSGSRKKLAVFRFYQPWESYIGISINLKEFLAPANLFIKISLLLITAFLLSIFLFTSIIQRIIINPLVRLTGFANRVTDGNFDTSLKGTYVLELRELKNHMQQMASTLQWEMNQAKAKLEMIREREANLDAALTELRKSEQKYRTIYDAPTDAIFILNPDTGKILDANKAMLMMFGYKEHELKDLTFASLSSGLPPYTEQEAGKRIARAGKQGWQFFEWIAKRSNGENFWVEISLRLADIDDQRQLIAIVRNVNIRKLAEEELASEKEQLAITLGSIGEGVITTDVQGRITLINRMAERLTGWNRAEAYGRTVSDVLRLLHPDTEQPAGNLVKDILSEGKVVKPTEEFILVKGDGTRMNVMASGSPITDSNEEETGMVVVFRDITEKKRLEDELFRVNKLESVGVLAGGIAHDFNNILTAILGNVSLARHHPENREATLSLLKKMEQAALRAKDLTAQLLTFSHGGVPVLQENHLEPLLRESTQSAMHGSDIVIRYDIPDDLWPVEIDAGQINQVLQNIILNARQAMVEQKGILTITCRNIPDCESAAELPAHACVRVTIADNGTGIPPETLPKIFDPYFTTKPEGNGLGLSICHSIIKKHNAQISVQSTPGSGTTFTIQFPAYPKQKLKKSSTEAGNMEIEKKKARILIMDDDQMIIDLSRQILEHLGHEVLTSENGETAISLYQRALDGNTPFDAVILDLTVPGGMGGRETMEELLRIDPNVKAIVSSGYSHDPVMSEYAAYGFKAVIVKPYQVEDLKNVIQQILQ